MLVNTQPTPGTLRVFLRPQLDRWVRFGAVAWAKPGLTSVSPSHQRSRQPPVGLPRAFNCCEFAKATGFAYAGVRARTCTETPVLLIGRLRPLQTRQRGIVASRGRARARRHWVRPPTAYDLRPTTYGLQPSGAGGFAGRAV